MFKRNPRFWGTAAIFLFVLIAYGQTLGMYFWQDDSALIFKLQNPAGPAGSFGAGIIGSGAYKYLVVPFVPFYKIFGLEPTGYFAVGLLTYLLAAAAFYLFAQELFGTLRQGFDGELSRTAQGKRAAFFATLIFAAGYVGSETMFRIINSWQTNVGLTLALVAFWLFTRYLREGGLTKYLLSVALFLVTLELVFIRSHSLILPILALDILLRFVPPRAKELPRLILRQLPFWFLWRSYYLTDASFGGPGIKSLIERVLGGELVALGPLFANIGNGLIPDILQTKVISFFNLGVFGASVLLTLFFISLVWVLGRLWKASLKTKLVTTGFLVLAFLLNQSFYAASPLWYRDSQSVVAGLVGLEVSILTFFAAFGLWRRNKTLAVALPFGLLMLGSQIFGYYTQYPTVIFSTTHRYFSYSFIGYSISFGSLLWLLLRYKNRLGTLFLIGLLGSNLFLGIRYQARLVEARSLPTRKFYQDLKKFVPRIEKGAAFYFDIAADPFYQRQFGNFFSVGSMPESTALAIYYGVDRYDLQMLTSFDELLFKLSKGEVDIDNTYTFFYGPQGLVYTTAKTRELLKNGSGTSNVSEASPLTLVLLTIEVSVSQADTPTFPYTHGTGGKEYSLDEKLKMLGYLESRKNYYRDVRASSLSEWKFREVRHAADADPDTVWQGHRIWWHEKSHEQLTVDLGSVKRVGRVVWQNWNSTLTPTSYTIQTSLDGKGWQIVKEVVDGPERAGGEYVVEEITPTSVRFIRMNITKTLTDDSPAILEFEVVESQYSDVSPPEALEFFKNPFSVVNNQKEWKALYSTLAGLGEANISWQTDKKDAYSSSAVIPISLDARMHTYEVVIPAGGTKLSEVNFNTNFPADIKLSRILAKNLSLSEIKARGLIKEFSEN